MSRPKPVPLYLAEQPLPPQLLLKALSPPSNQTAAPLWLATSSAPKLFVKVR